MVVKDGFAVFEAHAQLKLIRLSSSVVLYVIYGFDWGGNR